MDKIKTYIVPHFVGFLLLIMGWGISIVNIGIDRFKGDILNSYTVAGLIIIIIGSYLPEVWIAIANRK